MVTGGAAEGGCDVGVSVLAVDTDGEVAQAGHDAGQAAGAGLRGVLVEGAVADVVELVLDAPVATDQVASSLPVAAPGGRLVTR